MKEIVVKNRRQTTVTDEALYALDRESHKKWADQGLDAPWMHLTFEEFRQAIRHVTMFVALDAGTGELLGMHSFRPDLKEGWCYGFRLAVVSTARREGVASRMLAFEEECIRQAGYRYLKGVTATTAEWSVRWHLNNSYRIIGYYRSPNDNFANYVFRKQLVPSVLWDSAFYCRCRYLLSYTITRLTKDPQGHDTQLGRIAKRVSNRLVGTHRRDTTSH